MHFRSAVSPSVLLLLVQHPLASPLPHPQGQQRVSINDGWKFQRWESNPDAIIYNPRPDLQNLTDVQVCKRLHQRPSRPARATYRRSRCRCSEGQSSLRDSAWDSVDLPHDCAAAGPFVPDPDSPYVGMGRLPSQGMGWSFTPLRQTWPSCRFLSLMAPRLTPWCG